MVKNIKYHFGVNNIDFKISDFVDSKLELTPKIIVDVEFDDCIIDGIKIFYINDGFLVELDSKKISDLKSSELDKFLNNNKIFKSSFDDFVEYIKIQEKYGEIISEENNVQKIGN